jgi:hypothetical protein
MPTQKLLNVFLAKLFIKLLDDFKSNEVREIDFNWQMATQGLAIIAKP